MVLFFCINRGHVQCVCVLFVVSAVEMTIDAVDNDGRRERQAGCADLKKLLLKCPYFSDDTAPDVSLRYVIDMTP